MDLVEARARAVESAGRHPWERARVEAVRSLIERHAPLQAGDVVLDVGCGDSYVVEQLARRYPGVHFHAVDTGFTDETIGHLRARLEDVNVSLHRSLDDVQPLTVTPVAVVLLMDVLEHVADDRALLRDVASRRFVSPDTCFVITVPAYAWLFSSHDRLLGHYRRYSTPVLVRQIEAAGLAVVDHGSFFGSLLPVRILQAARERLFKAPPPAATGLSTWRGSEAAARAVAGVLRADARISMALGRAGISLPGLSNFAVCRKSA
jgi:2-polyprenyl-3-methyl-5-hydroxy-6-metoxy-1,4-benzoquinol methylase